MNDMRIIDDDVRKRSFVLPTRVVLTKGKVENSENLLLEQPLMLSFFDEKITWLVNQGSNEKAGILLDYGREMHGGIRILCPKVEVFEGNEATGEPAVTLRIRFGESASEAMTPLGEKHTTNDHAARDFTISVPWLYDQEWGQTGFRFVYIELQDPNACVAFKSLPAVFVRRDIPYRGRFRCNDERLNEIFDVSAYTCHLCMQGYLWDGIKRDRLIWIGDSHPEMLTIRSVFGYQPILEESLERLKETTALPRWMNDMPAYSLWWLYILADWYHYTGDRQFPDRQKDYILGLVDQLLGCINENGLMNLRDFFLDWPSNGKVDSITGVQALAVLAMQGAASLLTLWEEPERLRKVENAVETMRRHIPNDTAYKPAVAMAYLAGMLSDEEAKEKLGTDGVRGYSTFMSFYLLTATARTLSMTEALERLRAYYGGMLDMGATTFWEDFHLEWTEGAAPIDRLPKEGEKDIHGDFGDYCYQQFRHSLCHGWSSGPAPFLLESVLGIRFDEPGGKHITLSPDLGDLDWAEGAYPLPRGGELTVHCEKTANGVHTTYTAPEGVTVHIA